MSAPGDTLAIDDDEEWWMARADLLVTLVHAASKGQREQYRRALAALIAEERAKQHHVLADRLEEGLRFAQADTQLAMAHAYDERLLHETKPERMLDDLVLTAPLRRQLDRLLEEQQRAELLRSYDMEPRSRVLLVGPPGNGKTSVAEALASELYRPLVVVRYEGVVGSYLGETAARLARVFEYVRTRHCVLFFDEFDTIAKERADDHETGEIKRVVSSLLLQIDQLPSHVLVVTATNHAELLDRAVWRRFQVRLELPAPTRQQLIDWIAGIQDAWDIDLGRAPRTLADRLHGASFAEVEQFLLDLKREWILNQGADMRAVCAAQLSDWDARNEI
jgi:SpoVK/Ycf46/Vps4 family AAA+-type ATPase